MRRKPLYNDVLEEVPVAEATLEGVECYVEKRGYVSLAEQIKEMVRAGQNLDDYRAGRYDYENGLPEDFGQFPPDHGDCIEAEKLEAANRWLAAKQAAERQRLQEQTQPSPAGSAAQEVKPEAPAKPDEGAKVKPST